MPSEPAPKEEGFFEVARVGDRPIDLVALLETPVDEVPEVTIVRNVAEPSPESDLTKPIWGSE